MLIAFKLSLKTKHIILYLILFLHNLLVQKRNAYANEFYN